MVKVSSLKKLESDDIDLRIEWLHSLNEIEALKDEWLNLESMVSDRTVFAGYDYVIPWYRHYSGNSYEHYGEPLLGLAWEGKKLVGVAPLTFWRGTLGKVPVHRIDFAGFNAQAGEFLVLDDKPEITAGFINSLIDNGGFDFISLNSFVPESDKMEVLCNTVSARGLKFEKVDYRYAMVDLKSGYDHYYSSLNSKRRNNLKRHAKRISSMGNWQIDTIKAGNSWKSLSVPVDKMFSIYNKSWKVQEGGQLAEHHQKFYEEVASRFDKRGMTDIAILSINNKDTAFIFAIVERGFYYDVSVSYDESFAKISPGIFLMHELFKILPSIDIHTVISHGDRDYKKNWLTAFVPQTSVFIFSKGIKATVSRFVKFKYQPFIEQRKKIFKMN